MNSETRLAEEQAIKNNTGLVYMTVNQLRKRGKIYSWEIEDMTQEGLIGLLKAVRSYSQDAGVSFSTFAIKCISNEIMNRLAKMNREKRAEDRNHIAIEQVLVRGNRGGEIHLADVIPSKADVEADALAITEEEIRKIFHTIGQDDWCECLLRNAGGETLEAIGKSRGVTKQCIGMMVKNARSVVRAEVKKRGQG